MQIRSPGDVPAGAVRDLGLPGRAVNALTRAGITRTEHLAALTRRDLAAIDGLGPGMIAAIRQVVPEPGPAGPTQEPLEDDGPPSPEIPSFDSLRVPRRRSAFDLLVPEPPPAPAPGPTPAPHVAAPRPAEYADLLRLGVRAARALAGASARMTRWSVREPVRCLRRLLGA